VVLTYSRARFCAGAVTSTKTTRKASRPSRLSFAVVFRVERPERFWRSGLFVLIGRRHTPTRERVFACNPSLTASVGGSNLERASLRRGAAKKFSRFGWRRSRKYHRIAGRSESPLCQRPANRAGTQPSPTFAHAAVGSPSHTASSACRR